jgi:Dolichyl-phosphate-mannose-protein mannosyltransferase
VGCSTMGFPSGPSDETGRYGYHVLVAVVLVAALLLRLRGITFGLPALNDPDELMFQMGAVRMLTEPTLNPGWFGHPATTTIYLLALIDVMVYLGGWLTGYFVSPEAFAQAVYANPTWVILPGRLAMAGFGLLSIWLTFKLGSALFARWAGLAAAALLAFNPVHVTYSQIIRSDMMATCFMLLCMLAAVRISRHNRWCDWVMASMWLALAVATKWPFALTGLSVLGIAARALRYDPANPHLLIRRLMLFLFMTLGFLLLFSPYLLLDHETVLRNLAGEARLKHLGATGGSPLANAWWYFSGPILNGLGPGGAFLAASGIVPLLRRPEALYVMGPVGGGFFILLSLQPLIWERWALPLMPLLAIAAGVALFGMVLWLSRRFSQTGLAASAMLCLVVLGTLLLRTNADVRERTNDTRQQATAWAERNIPSASTVLVEHFGFDLLGYPWNLLFPLGDVGCVDAREMLQGRISYAIIERGRSGRSVVDYGTLAPNRRFTCRADYAILTHAERYKAERNAFPVEDAAYQSLVDSGEIVKKFRPRDGEIGGPVVLIVKISIK